MKILDTVSMVHGYSKFLDLDELDVDTVMEGVSGLCKACPDLADGTRSSLEFFLQEKNNVTPQRFISKEERKRKVNGEKM